MIVYLYFIWVIGFPLLIMLFGSTSIRHSNSNCSYLPEFDLRYRKTSNRTLQMCCWLIVVCFLYGPPWRFDPSSILLNNHETVHLKGIQALLTGADPYIGAANSQYGPLIQLGAVWWMRLRGESTVAVFREYWSLLNFTGLLLFVLLVFKVYRTQIASVVCLITFSFSTFTFFGFTSSGFNGIFGWANPLRYMAVLLLAVSVVRNSQIGWPKTSTTKKVSVGFGLAILSLLSQENLIASSLLLGILLTVFVVGNHASQVTAILYLRLVGLSLYASLFLVSMAITGPENFLAFWKNYFHIPIAVQRGYSNLRLGLPTSLCCEQDTSVQWLLVLSVFATLICGVVLAVLHRNSISSSSTRTGIRTVFILWLASAIVQASALTRMDSSHLRSSLVLFPIWFVGYLFEVPKINRARSNRLLALVVTLVLVAPLMGVGNDQIPFVGLIEKSRYSFNRLKDNEPSNADPVTDRPLQFSELTRDDFEKIQRNLQVLGKETYTYIDPTTTPLIGDELGLYYFIADLNPMPVPYDEQTTAISEREVQKNLEALANPAYSLCNLVTSNPYSPFSNIVRARGNFEFIRSFIVGVDVIYILHDRQCGRN